MNTKAKGLLYLKRRDLLIKQVSKANLQPSCLVYDDGVRVRLLVGTKSMHRHPAARKLNLLVRLRIGRQSYLFNSWE